MYAIKYDINFDRKMQEQHPLIVQQAELRRLVGECTDPEFVHFFLDVKIERFRAGQLAKEYFNQCKVEFEKIKMYGSLEKKLA